MMTPEPESTRNYHDPVTASGDGFMGLFEELSREEILEVLSEGFCHHCGLNFEERIRNLPHRKVGAMSLLNKNGETSPESFRSMSNLDSMTPASHQIPFHSTKRLDYSTNSSPSSLTSKQHFNHHDSEIPLNDGVSGPNSAIDYGMPEEQKDRIRFSQVGRKKDFVYVEKINGKPINVVQGLELYTRVFNYEEQKRIVECVYDLQRMGQMGRLRERTYSEPRKWMRGKGRVTIQFGCCYNYAVDKSGNPPGIVRDEEVDPLPQLFKQMIRRMVRWHIVPPDCVPDSCIVNIYDEGDCIPPHIDHHDFLRPFCTVSFLAECNILFGSNLKIVSPGEFSGPVSIPLPVGSVLILNGNGADVAKHCIPAVPTRRISITFRKMDDSKIPYNFSPEPDLIGIRTVQYSPTNRSGYHQNLHHRPPHRESSYDNSPIERNRHKHQQTQGPPFVIGNDDFPPLGGSSSYGKRKMRPWTSDKRRPRSRSLIY